MIVVRDTRELEVVGIVVRDEEEGELFTVRPDALLRLRPDVAKRAASLLQR